MKNILFIILIASVSLIAQKNEPKTVENVDLSRYVGKWYEIAKIPNKFQKHCVKGTTAEYFLQEDGTIKVINSCIEEDGSLDKAEGIAVVVDKKTNSKLEVSFVSFLGWRPFWGDYWIIGLGDNYEYAVVGSPDREYGWILSRSKKLSDETLSKIFQLLRENGFNTKAFRFGN